MATQLEIAKAGRISTEVEYVAKAEGVEASLVRDEVAAGRLVIPANVIHLKRNLKPAGIGRVLTTKVNANIGVSSVRSTVAEEIEKMGLPADWYKKRAGPITEVPNQPKGKLP